MTLEAMKMEHVHTAGVAGTVSAIDVAEGEQVTTGKIVVEIAAGVAQGRSAGVGPHGKPRGDVSSHPHFDDPA